jgi:hypothetical protein
MKIFKRIAIWVMVSIAIQMSGFYYINKYYLSDETNIKVSKLQKNTDTAKSAEVAVPFGVQNINASYNGKYVAYDDSGVLNIVDMSTGEKKTLDFDSGVEVSCYKWLSDRNRMLIAEKHTTSSGISFELAYYDVDKDTKEKIEDLAWTGKSAEVSAIEASPLTNVIFIKIALNDEQSTIYWMNIMADKKKISTVTSSIGNISIVPHEDKLLYENTANNKVYMTGSKSALSVGTTGKAVLLSIDNNDNAYLGELADDGTISRVYYGQTSAASSTYSVIELGKAVSRDAILVSSEGKIYINDNFTGTITDMAAAKQYVYKGNFQQIYDGGILSLSDNKLVKTPITAN